MKSRLLTWLCTFLLAAVSDAKSETTIFGPGLSRFFEVPTRYFYVTIADGSTNLTMQDFVKGDLKVWLSPVDDERKRVRAAADILSTSDLSGVVRFRLHESYEKGVIIHITRKTKRLKAGDEELAGSPIQIKGPLYHDECYCPLADMEKWFKALECPVPSRENSFYSQVINNLSPFSEKGINMSAVLIQTKDRFAKHRYSHSFCHYAVVNNQVYRKCYGEHVGFKMFTDNILLFLTRRVRLPDLEFISNLGDWPLSQDTVEPLLPIISWCGSSSTVDIILPTYDIVESSLHMLDRVSLDMLSVRANTGPVWSEKEPKAFWRGRDSRQERLDLVKFSKKHPELVDANLTHVFFFREQLSEFEPLAKTVSFFDFFKYKYQLNIDGTVAAYRLPYLLSGDSLVLKQDSNYYEHFYGQLKPWFHYVPLKSDLSDLEEKLEWAKSHDAEAKEIVQNAQNFAWKNLLPHHIICYHGFLFQEYAKLLLTAPDVNDMEVVEQPKSDCRCLRDTVSPKPERSGEL